MEHLPLHDRLLRHYIREAILRQTDRLAALAIARKVEVGDYRVIGTFALDRYDCVDPASMTFRVEVQALDGWAELCSVHWTLLGLEWADMMAEVDNVYRQHAEGTYPGGPMDARR